MTKDHDLQSALAALDEYGYDKKASTDLEQARNKQQMSKYINSLNFSLRRLLILQETINEIVAEKQFQSLHQERVQTFKTKIINLSREYNISYDEVLQVMANNTNK